MNKVKATILLMGTKIFVRWSWSIKYAMKMKIRDLGQVLNDNHRRRRQLEDELHRLTGKRSWVTRQRIKKIKAELNKEKQSITKKYENKINHYKSTMSRLKHIRGTPQSERQSVGIDGMNKDPIGVNDNRTVGMNGMNKDPVGVNDNRSVDMDGMNKDPVRGGGDRTVDMDLMNEDNTVGAREVPYATVIPTLPPRNLQEFSTSPIFNAP